MTTSLARLQDQFSSALARQVTLHPASERETRIEVPFYFPDGDGFVVYLRDIGGDEVEFTDRAHTLMHIGYHTDVDRFYSGPRADVFERVQARHGVEDRDGELVTRTPVERAPEALFDFVQALIEISDIRNLDREIVRSTFRDDLQNLLVRSFDDIEIDYVDRAHDEGGKFPIPYRLNGTSRPIAIFDIASDDHAASAFAIASQHLRWQADLHLVAIERDQELLKRQRVAWISDLFHKQFASLVGNEDRIVEYLRDQHALSRLLDRAPS